MSVSCILLQPFANEGPFYGFHRAPSMTKDIFACLAFFTFMNMCIWFAWPFLMTFNLMHFRNKFKSEAIIAIIRKPVHSEKTAKFKRLSLYLVRFRMYRPQSHLLPTVLAPGGWRMQPSQWQLGSFSGRLSWSLELPGWQQRSAAQRSCPPTETWSV